jgi:serine/threonine-protein kinase
VTNPRINSPELETDRYRLLDPIGKGANATVWRASDRESGQTVAIKVLRADAMTLEDVQRFAQEVEILRALSHPCIVRLHGTGVARGGFPYVVMELVEGANLRYKLAKRRQLPQAEVRYVVTQICGALVEAHKAGVVHRDIKPENVLLRAPGYQQVVLVDFGTAKRLGSQAPVLTFDDKILGTPQYMSPERASGNPVGGAADVYAVAIMTFEMLTGRLPFDGTSPIMVVTQQIRDPPPPMTGIAAAVEQAVLRGLTKDPVKRPSAEEYAELLCRAMDGAGIPRR